MFWKKQSNKFDGQFIIVVGATRSGKSTYVKNLLKKTKSSVLILTTSIYPWENVRELRNEIELVRWRYGWARLTGLLYEDEFSPAKLLLKNNYILVIDDAPALISSRSSLNWDRVLLTHRNHGITVFYISQSFRKVPKHIINTSDIWMIGYLANIHTEENYLSDLYGRKIHLPRMEPYSFKILRVRK